MKVGTNLLTADGNDAVSLYFGGAAKLATTSTGIDVTGAITSDALSCWIQQHLMVLQ